MAAACILLVGCGDVDESSSRKKEKDVTTADSSYKSGASSEDGQTETQAPEPEESSETETTVTDDYTKPYQIIDETHSRLTQEPLDDKAVETAFKWSNTVFGGDIEEAKKYCTHEFAQALGDIYKDYLSEFIEISINGYNYHVDDTPLAGINLLVDSRFNKLAWLRLVPQDDGSYLVCDIWEDRGRDDPESLMDRYGK